MEEPTSKGKHAVKVGNHPHTNMNRLITSTEIETVIKKSTTDKSPGPDGFTGKF